ncbi:MAG: hypothetical protein LAP85_13730 [Acidobacteriia bacterium]|nr:hypothetical protein [Terriglobia bacterium]
MSETVLWGQGPDIIEKPAVEWLAALRAKAPLRREQLRLAGPGRRVREYAVRELARNSGRPLEPERIASALALPLAQTRGILQDLERGLFYLAMDSGGRVSWAFPVTSVRTPHQLRLSTGETTWGA